MSQVYKAVSEPMGGEVSSSTPLGFLDYEGVKHLWSKVSMKDYPNNETLAAVINAIDETKADKSELFSGSWNDLSDKPFGENEKVEITHRTIEYNYTYINLNVEDVSELLSKGSFLISVNNIEYEMKETSRDNDSIGFENIYYTNEQCPIKIRVNTAMYEITIYTSADAIEYPFTLSIYKNDLKQLDSKFIGPDIARIEDIVTPVQSNWLENSSESISYIQNKPFYEETKYLLQRTIFNCSEIHSDYYPYYTDKNNFIYTALKVGKTYGINYLKDFGEYKDWSYIELIAQDVGGNIAIGNLSIMNNDNHNYEDTGEEFMILWLINHDYGIICTKEPKEIEIHEISTNELKQLDDKFISNNIARVSDIPIELTVEDAIALATETGLIDPIATTSDNTILTDVNNNIITL